VNLRAAIFDIDGTLIDSNDLHAQAWREAFAHFGRHIPFRFIRQQVGKGADTLMPVFLSRLELEQFGNELEEFRGQLFKRKYLPKVKPFDGVRPLFERISKHALQIGLASSAKGRELAAYKRIANIEDLVQEETSRDDAHRSKPEPDIFVAALDRLDVGSDEAVVIGDTPYDGYAASEPGIAFIAVRSGGWDDATLKRAGAVAVYENIADLLARYDDSVLASASHAGTAAETRVA
jgi:HAD superfamily hydrolase (TIGR01549 family)